MKTRTINQFLIRTAIFILTLVVLDFLIGQSLRYYYFKQKSGALYRTTYAMEENRSDLLIIGSSRANHHYYTPALQKELNMSVYNAGRDGNYLLYNTAILRSSLKRYTPKVVILDYDVNMLRVLSVNYDRLSNLLPYYRNHEEVRDIINLKGPFEKVKLASSLYPFNSMIFTVAAGNMDFNRKRKEDFSGYVPLKKICTTPLDYETTYKGTDATMVNCFRSFIADAKAAGSKVFIVISPVHYLYKGSESVDTAVAICKKNDVQLLDFSRDTTFLNNNKLFADRAHLNHEGAQLFTDMLLKRIKLYVNEKS